MNWSAAIFYSVCFLQILFSLGCGSSAVKDYSGNSFLYSTKAQLTDKVKDSSQNANIDVFVDLNKAIRLEVTALLGYQVGSLLMNTTEIRYAVHSQKVFVQGPFQPRTLKPLFKQEIDPKILWSVVQNESLSKRGFQCAKKSNAVEVCQNPQAQVEIEQRGELDPNGLSLDGQKKITIENDKMKMIWIFKSKEAYIDSQNETFVLNSPKDYRLVTIK